MVADGGGDVDADSLELPGESKVVTTVRAFCKETRPDSRLVRSSRWRHQADAYNLVRHTDASVRHMIVANKIKIIK